MTKFGYLDMSQFDSIFARSRSMSRNKVSVTLTCELPKLVESTLLGLAPGDSSPPLPGVLELYKKKDIPRRIFPDGIEGDIAMRNHTETADVEVEENDVAPVENKVIQHDVSLAEMIDDI